MIQSFYCSLHYEFAMLKPANKDCRTASEPRRFLLYHILPFQPRFSHTNNCFW